MSDSNAEADMMETIGAEEARCQVVELRQYMMKPGRRDELIALFEEHFIEEQEQYGSCIIGQFRQRANPDQFVWLRGFRDMEARRQALQGFYYGPTWQVHRAAANDTMIDSDNVLLLKPARATSGFHIDPAGRPALDAPEIEGGLISATVYAFDAPVNKHFVDFFENSVIPMLREAGATLLGYFVTESQENTFPALPVREDEHVFVWFSSFASEAAYTVYRSTLAENREWSTNLLPALRERLAKPEEVLELIPTRRSLLHHC